MPLFFTPSQLLLKFPLVKAVLRKTTTAKPYYKIETNKALALVLHLIPPQIKMLLNKEDASSYIISHLGNKNPSCCS